jgi:hypothetical protein
MTLRHRNIIKGHGRMTSIEFTDGLTLNSELQPEADPRGSLLPPVWLQAAVGTWGNFSHTFVIRIIIDEHNIM